MLPIFLHVLGCPSRKNPEREPPEKGEKEEVP
jgi:hypothetical protein